MHTLCFYLFTLLTLLVPLPLTALEAGEALADPVLETRAVALGAQLRCVVCQSESINDSQADLAKDLRRLIREKLMAKQSDTEILDFVHERYGDFVLLSPPIKNETIPLWAAPWVFLALGLGVFAFILRRKQKS